MAVSTNVVLLLLIGLGAEVGLAHALGVPLRLGNPALGRAPRAWRRWLTGLAAPVVAYAVVAILFVVFARMPSPVPTTVVTPVPGLAAARAGVRAGDEVTAVAGEPVTSWPALRQAVAAHPGPIDLTVERQGRRLTLHVSREGTGPIGVMTRMAAKGPRAGHLLRAATVLPFLTGTRGWLRWIRSVAGMLGPGVRDAAVAGPVGRQVVTARGLRGRATECVSASMALFVALPAALVLGPLLARRRRTAPAP